MLLWALTQHSRGCYLLLQHIVFTESNYFLLIATLLEMQYRSGEVNQNQCLVTQILGHILQALQCKGPTNFQITLHCCTSQKWCRAQFSYQICILTNTLALFDKWHPIACSEVCLCYLNFRNCVLSNIVSTIFIDKYWLLFNIRYLLQ